MAEQGLLILGRVIDPGCGEGDNAIFMAQPGFDGTAADFASAALAKGTAEAQKAGGAL